MIFKFEIVLLMLMGAGSLVHAEIPEWQQYSPSLVSAGLIAPIGRPLFLRSDALSLDNYQKLRRLSYQKTDLRTGVPYDRGGFPRLTSRFDLQLSPAQYVSPYYGKIANKQLLKEMQSNPALRKKFTQRDLELLQQGKNPQGTHWHHGTKGQLRLVDARDHSVDHVGGDKAWGRIDRKTFLRSTALRWGSVAALDIAVSSATTMYAGEFQLDYFAQATSRAVAAGTVAFGTELLLVKLMPNTVGMPPRWFPGLRVLHGGPAAWAGTASYIATRALVDHCWEKHRLNQLKIQEQACRLAEKKARWQRINVTREKNDQALNNSLLEI